MWDQSLKDFYVGSREEVTGHFLLMKAILPYLENITGGFIYYECTSQVHENSFSHLMVTKTHSFT